MGLSRGKSIKRAARQVISSYFSRINADFENNLSVVRDVTITQNKKTRNQLAGFVTHLYKRIQRGSVQGIYIRAHEQEREKKESFIPKVGVLDVEKIVVDPVTMAMVKKYEIQGNFIAGGSENAN